MVAGPYSAGGTDAVARAANLKRLNEAALALFRRGHVPIIGVNLALPLVEIAGPDRYEEVMMPLSLAASERCDACLRIGGSSKDADDEVERFRARGSPVYFSVEDVPAV